MSCSRPGSSTTIANGNKSKKGSTWEHRMILADRDDMMIWISNKIKDYVHHSSFNRSGSLGEGQMLDDPIIGFTSGADPLFSNLKQVIGPFHSTPYEVLVEEAGLNNLPLPNIDDIGVIAYVLPITTRTRWDNSEEIPGPPERRAHTRLYGEKLNKSLENHIVALLMEQGYLAAAPDLSSSFRMKMDDRIGPSSTWSHRHIAYAVGLGPFGPSDGLITEKEIAHLFGSVVVNIPFPKAKRKGLHQDCLYF